MKLKQISFLLLFLVFQNVRSENEEYFEKSIIRALKDKNGHFNSEIVYVLFGNKTVREKYSFSQKSGEHFEGSEYDSYKTLYLNSTEIHTYSEKFNFCHSSKFNNYSVRNAFYSWGPTIIFNKTFTYTFLGPTVLLDILLQSKDKAINCTDLDDETKSNYKKCSIEFQKMIKLDYYFYDKDGYTMYPEKILGYMKIGRIKTNWQLKAQFHYLSFSASFEQEAVISTNLPFGLGCERPNPDNYPKIETNYGRKFELDQNVLFNYTHSLTYFFGNRTIKKHNSETHYSNKLYVDLDNSINDAKTVNETTKEPIRTIYDQSTNMLHSINLNEEDAKCLSYNLTSNNSINWFYVQDSFVKRTDLYYAKNYSYLGDTNLDDVPCLVFEKKFDFYQYSDFYTRYFYNQTMKIKKTTRGNKNKLEGFDYVISTHYYPKEINYWPENTNQLSVPKRIEIKILDGRSRVNYLVVDTKSFNPNPKEYEKYETDQCTNMDL